MENAAICLYSAALAVLESLQAKRGDFSKSDLLKCLSSDVCVRWIDVAVNFNISIRVLKAELHGWVSVVVTG